MKSGVKITTTLSNLDQLNIQTSSNVIETVEQQTAEIFAKQTSQLILKDFNILQKSAQLLLDELIKEEKIVSNLLNKELEQMKADNPKIQTSLELSLILAKKTAIYFQHLLIKAYDFIERFRELVTSTKIDYLIYLDTENGQIIKTVTLEELIPTLSIALGSKKELKLQISRMSALTELAQNSNDANEAAIKIKMLILQIYDYLIGVIKTYVNKKGKQVRIMPGFAFEAALQAATENPNLNLSNTVAVTNYLTDLYKNTIGNKAFYRGGDLDPSKIPPEIIQLKGEVKEYQLKRIKVAENSLGAQMVTVTTIKRVLRTIISILRKDFKSVDEITEALKHFIFTADTNVTNRIETMIREKTAEEITALIKNKITS